MKYLQPLFESTRLRQEYLEEYGRKTREWEPGSIEWCASQLGEMVTGALMKYRIISGDTVYDEFLKQDADGFGNLLLTGNLGLFQEELNHLADAFRFNKAVYTDEVRHTDRVFAFPDYYLNFFYEAASARKLAGLLQQSVTGDPGHYSYFPLEALSWKTDVGDLASVVLVNTDKHLEILAYNFTSKSSYPVKIKMLKAGNYSLEIKGRSTEEKRISQVSIAGPGTIVGLDLFPKREQTVILKKMS
jgi:hypothetical protein